MLQTEVGQVLRGLLGIELGELCLDLGADRHGNDAARSAANSPVISSSSTLATYMIGFMVSRNRPLAAVRSSGVISMVAARLPSLSHSTQALGDVELGHGLVVALGLLLQLGQLLLERLHVGQDELRVDDVGVAHGVDELAVWPSSRMTSGSLK